MSKRIAVKFGGSLAQDQKVLSELTEAVAHLANKGHHVAMVHGGGKNINANLELLKEEVKFVNGLRVTDEAVLDMVEMTLSGQVNKMLVRLFLSHQCKAVGISGIDGALFEAEKLIKDVDLGFVGEIKKVNTEIVESIWKADMVPVVSPISVSADGSTSWNVNADNAASALAAGLQVDELVFVSDVPGVLQDGEVISELNEEKIEALIDSEVIQGGMIPKTRSSIESIKAGIQSIHIVGWKGAELFEKQLLGELNYGTIIS